MKKLMSYVKQLFIVCLLICGVAVVKPNAVQASQVSVTFNNFEGNSTASFYKSLAKKCSVGSSITLPDYPKVSGYVNLGWSPVKKSTKDIYKIGSKVKISKNTTFYAVRVKNSSVVRITYDNYNGNSTASFYKTLEEICLPGTTIKLPDFPSVSGYKNLGWSMVKGNSDKVYKVGETVKINKNTVFYSVRQNLSIKTVTFYQKNGSVASKKTVSSGGYIRLPELKNLKDYTILGWDTVPNKINNPKYIVDETIKVTSDMKLYPVYFNNAKDKLLATVPALDTSKYSRLVFIGDSRMVLMSETMDRRYPTSWKKNISFVAKKGATYTWWVETGKQLMRDNIKKYGKGTASRPIAIVFNLGVNSPMENQQMVQNYIKLLNELYNEMKPNNCKFFFVSINPTNQTMCMAADLRSQSRDLNNVVAFNRSLRNAIGSKYQYIDSFNYLIDNGFGYDCEGVDDGLHFDDCTNARLFDYYIRNVNRL